MTMTTTRHLGAAIAASLTSLASWTAPASAAPAEAPPHRPFASAPLTAAALASRRGGERVVNDTQLKGAVSDNQANNVSTGANALGGGAFTGSSGISTVIQNTGNNVLIQNSTVVNVQLK